MSNKNRTIKNDFVLIFIVLLNYYNFPHLEGSCTRSKAPTVRIKCADDVYFEYASIPFTMDSAILLSEASS